MPKFWRRQSEADGAQSPWFVKIRNRSPPPPTHTFQLKPTAIRILREMGLNSGDYFDEDQFWTLRNLGLTYTLGEDGDTIIDFPLSKADAMAVPPEHRVTFVTELLTDHTIAALESEGFCRVLRAIEQGPDDLQFELLEHITQDTPVSPGSVDGLVGPHYTSPIFGALVCRAFTKYLDTRDGEIRGEYEPIGHADGYAYTVINRSAWDEIECLAEFSLDIPQFYLDEALPPDHSEDWATDILVEIHESQFLGDSAGRADSTAGRLIFDGLEHPKPENEHFSSAMPRHLIIVPRDALADQTIRNIV